jgi:hypothetical protein
VPGELGRPARERAPCRLIAGTAITRRPHRGQILRALRTDRLGLHVPVVVVTALGHAEVVAKVQGLGVRHILPKHGNLFPNLKDTIGRSSAGCRCCMRQRTDAERDQWEVDRRMMMQVRDEQSREIERLDLAYDKLRRERHHATTTRLVDNNEAQ